MKRSSYLKLSLMAPLGLVMTGCEQQTPTPTISLENTRTYQSIDECVNGGIYTEKACTDSFNNAEQQLPKFGSIQECELAHGEGNCTQNQRVVREDGSSWVTPALLGYMVGSMNSSSGASGMNTRMIHQPIYRDRSNNGNFSVASTNRVNDVNSAVSNHNRQVQTQRQSSANRPATTRSGFGSSSSSRGSFGG